METPGVAPVAAPTVLTAIDDPERFRRSRDVAAYFGGVLIDALLFSGVDVIRKLTPGLVPALSYLFEADLRRVRAFSPPPPCF